MHSLEHGGTRSETWERQGKERGREIEKGVPEGERVRDPPTICPQSSTSDFAHYTQLNCKPATVT